MLLTSEEQAGKSWKPANTSKRFRHREALDKKMFPH